MEVEKGKEAKVYWEGKKVCEGNKKIMGTIKNIWKRNQGERHRCWTER